MLCCYPPFVHTQNNSRHLLYAILHQLSKEVPLRFLRMANGERLTALKLQLMAIVLIPPGSEQLFFHGAFKLGYQIRYFSRVGFGGILGFLFQVVQFYGKFHGGHNG